MANPLVANVDVVIDLAEFVDEKQYLFFAPVSTTWNMAWGQRPKTTCAVTAHTTVPQLVQSLMSGLEQGKAVCRVAARLGRLDLLKCARLYGCPWPSNCTAKLQRGGILTS